MLVFSVEILKNDLNFLNEDDQIKFNKNFFLKLSKKFQ